MKLPEIILASGSSSRRTMLNEAGMWFRAVTPAVDEERLKTELVAKSLDAASVADALAEAKALSISTGSPNALVIGADQILVCGSEMFNKAIDRAGASSVLRRLRGVDHMLISAAVLAAGNSIVWRIQETATLRMRKFSDAFLEAYLDAEMPGILGSVGCYRIEGRGLQLFERVDGDQFCIRGLPLLAMLAALRERGALPT
jgi:septum formation protein